MQIWYISFDLAERFNTQINKNSSASGDSVSQTSYRGFPWTQLGDFRPPAPELHLILGLESAYASKSVVVTAGCQKKLN